MNEVYKTSFTIGNSYRNVVSYDIVDLGASHILLERPWQHDVNAISIKEGRNYFICLSGME